MKTGVLLINLGTPSAATHRAVYHYLSEFLSDNKVISMPCLLRYILLYTYILPLRLHTTTKAYRKIWTKQGSPLYYFSQELCHAVQSALGADYHVVLAMRYGKPNLKQACDQLKDYAQLIVLPLYPHYANATTGSAITELFKQLQQYAYIPRLNLIHTFYQHPAFILAMVKHIQPYINTHDHLLFSYHGIPINHNAYDYQQQCLQTSQHIAEQLNLNTTYYSSAFQSRVGRTAWTQPYTEQHLYQLRQQGIQNLAIACPSFVVDCLETLEEIGIRAKTIWRHLGGQSLTLIPALNTTPSWIDAICEILRYNIPH